LIQEAGLSNDIITIRLAGVPEGKGRARSTLIKPRGKPAFISNYTPANTRRYESNLKFVAQEIMGGRAPLEGPLKVCVFASFPVPASWSKKKQAAALSGEVRPTTKPDADNLMKVLDALNQVVWRDDSQIVDGFVRKFYSETPGLVVTIEHAFPVAVPAQPTLFAGEAA
jgi:Holliday junction resolvase RusA-like endonuclease